MRDELIGTEAQLEDEASRCLCSLTDEPSQNYQLKLLGVNSFEFRLLTSSDRKTPQWTLSINIKTEVMTIDQKSIFKSNSPS